MSTISVQDFLKSTAHTAHHFGFVPLERLKETSACKECLEKLTHKATAQDRKLDSLHGILTQGVCSYFDHKLNALPGPSLFYSLHEVPRTGDLAVAFHIINVKKSIAEALLIQAMKALLSEMSIPEYTVHINSLGDSDSVSRYIRDLTHFLRKRVDEMPPQARELMKDHPLVALMHLIDKDHDLARRSPNPLEYLTDTSRKHFREIIEYLDMSSTPFEIDPKLIGHHDCYSDALFSIEVPKTDPEEQSLTIRGGRYGAFVGRMSKHKIPATGSVIILHGRRAPSNLTVSRPKQSTPVFLVQLGFGPKIKSLLLLEELRTAGIPVLQNVMSDSLSEQLRQAETQNARYAIILGHKEFMDGNVILRDLKKQSQEHIPSSILTNHIKKILNNVRG